MFWSIKYQCKRVLTIRVQDDRGPIKSVIGLRTMVSTVISIITACIRVLGIRVLCDRIPGFMGLSTGEKG